MCEFWQLRQDEPDDERIPLKTAPNLALQFLTLLICPATVTEQPSKNKIYNCFLLRLSTVDEYREHTSILTQRSEKIHLHMHLLWVPYFSRLLEHDILHAL